MSSRTKTFLIAASIIVVLAGGYLLFFNNNSDTTAVSTSGAPASADEVNFLNLAGKLNQLTFNTSVITDPRFTSLIDIHTVILPEDTGRTDPFATLPGGASSSQ